MAKSNPLKVKILKDMGVTGKVGDEIYLLKGAAKFFEKEGFLKIIEGGKEKIPEKKEPAPTVEKKESPPIVIKPTNPKKSMQEYLELYDNLGIVYVPQEYGGKITTIKWKDYQTTKPTDEEKEKWFKNKETNVAAMCGAISGNLLVVDFDKPEVLREFFPEKEKDILKETFAVKTKRGYHVYIRTTKPTRTKSIGGIVEVLGEGHLATMPPSLHPSGIHYEPIGVDKIVEITDFDDVFWKKAKELGYYEERGIVTPTGHLKKIPESVPPCIENMLAGVTEGSRNRIGFIIAVFFKNQGRPMKEVEDILHKWNELNSSPLSPREIKTITDSVSANEYGIGCNNPELKSRCSSKKGECIYQDMLALIKENTESVLIKKPEVEGDPYIYEITILGKKIELDSSKMLNAMFFKRRWLEEHKNLIHFSDERWFDLVNFWFKHEKMREVECTEESAEKMFLGFLFEYFSRCEVTMNKELAIETKKMFYVEEDISKLPDDADYNLYFSGQQMQDVINMSKARIDIARISKILKKYLAETSRQMRIGDKRVRFWVFKKSLVDIDWRKKFIVEEKSEETLF